MIEHEVTIGGMRLIQGNMRGVLPSVAERVDLVVSDVPYKLTIGGNAHESMGGIFNLEQYDNSGDLMDTVAWSEMGGPIYRASADNADFYIMANYENLFAAHDGFINAGYKFYNLLVWDRVRATPNRWYMKNLEFALHLWKGRARKAGNNDCGSKLLFDLNAKRATGHPTEKPDKFMGYCIRNSGNQGDMVLDSFMRSGSTMVAAAKLGRRGIGMETNPK